MKPTTSDLTYDVFLSHSAHDKAVIRELAMRLHEDGLRVWFDEWVIQPGDMIGRVVESGLDSSRVLVLAMSRHAFDSDWARLESGTFRFRDPTDKRRRFVPLRLDDTEPNDTIRQFAYVDWRERSEAQYQLLLAACRPTLDSSISAVGPASTMQSARVLRTGARSLPWVAISKNGRRGIAAGSDNNVQVWNLETGRSAGTLAGHRDLVNGVAISADGHFAASSSKDATIRVWDLNRLRCVQTIESPTGPVLRMSLAADGQRVFSGGGRGDTQLWIWSVATGDCLASLAGHSGRISDVAVTPDGSRAISGCEDGCVGAWDLATMSLRVILRGHTGKVGTVSISANGARAVSGSRDSTVRVWDLTTGKLAATLEGHTDGVWGVDITPDGRRAVSGSHDRTIRVWDLDSGNLISAVGTIPRQAMGVSISEDGRRLLSGSYAGAATLWHLPAIAADAGIGRDDHRYTNAKVLLVGESGVGKTGLACRLTEDCFREAISTDAVWATQMRLSHKKQGGEIEREIWLWDFAGQADYRLIHQLYMDETALAILVFNPQSENPFEGLGQWDRDLQRAARRPFRKLLVAGRIDRGGLMLSRESVEHFRQERGFAEYLETSALRGTGCDALRDAIIAHISWTDIPWTASPRIFRLLKDEIVRLKDEGKVLLRMVELEQQLRLRLVGESFSIEQVRAVANLLAGPGVVWPVEFGDFVLLQPERINAYAAAVIRSVRAHTDEIGCVAEDEMLAGRLDYQDMQRLPRAEEQIVLRAMHQVFVERGLCLRETTEQGALLIFPSYFKRERPELEGHPVILVTYQFDGPLDEVYATLVVRLHHTRTFERAKLWRFAADFRTPGGKRLGLKLTKKAEGAGEMDLYFEPGVALDTEVSFIRYVHDHLVRKVGNVIRVRHYVCPSCAAPVENRRAVQSRLEKGLKDIVCVECEKRVPLWDVIEEKFASPEFQRRVQGMEELAKAAIDNESKELILVGHAFSTVGEAGQIFRPTANSDWGIDGEIEFKNTSGEASGRRVYLQLKSGDSYLWTRGRDGQEIFSIKNPRHAEYWQAHEYPVMLVIRTSNGEIRWMNVTDALRRSGAVRQVIFAGEPFTALNVFNLRRRLFPELGT